MWIRNHSTNRKLDKFIRTLIEHKDEVNVIKLDEYTLTFEFRDRVFSVWISNKWYAYLHRVYEHKVVEEDGKHKYQTYPYMNEVEIDLPSRISQLEFYELIHKPNILQPKDPFEFFGD